MLFKKHKQKQMRANDIAKLAQTKKATSITFGKKNAEKKNNSNFAKKNFESNKTHNQ